MEKLDLKTYEFPVVKPADEVFPTWRTDVALLEEAKARGFYLGHTLYNDLFSKLFYDGGKVKFKENLDEEFLNRAWPYCRSFMGSWEPSHEDKEAVCALLMSELLEPKLAE